MPIQRVKRSPGRSRVDREAVAAEIDQSLLSILNEPAWKHMLELRSSPMHHYSMHNICFLIAQADVRGMEISHVRGYRAWQRLGRQVRQGEHGLRVFVPITVTRKVEEETTEGKHEVYKKVLVGFKLRSVFDISQTEGPDLPDFDSFRLQGVDIPGLGERIVDLLKSDGWEVEEVECIPHSESALGCTDPNRMRVLVRSDLSPVQRAKTLAHELAHVTLGHTASNSQTELEAESVAFLVCRSAGIDTGQYSFPYFVNWAQTEKNPEKIIQEVKDVFKRVERTTEQIAQRLGLEQELEEETEGEMEGPGMGLGLEPDPTGTSLGQEPSQGLGVVGPELSLLMTPKG